MKRTPRAVMGCNKKQSTPILVVGGQVKSEMTTNALMFPGTATAIVTLGGDLTLLGGYISNAKGNSIVRSQRDVQAAKVYGQLQALLFAVNTVAMGNVATIALSGFPCSADATPHAVPGQVIIKKIVPGVTEFSAKILIASLKQPHLTYIVRTTTVAGAPVNDPSWVTVLRTTNSRKLILTGLVHHQDIYIDVNASNVAGVGMFSDPMMFSA